MRGRFKCGPRGGARARESESLPRPGLLSPLVSVRPFALDALAQGSCRPLSLVSSRVRPLACASLKPKCALSLTIALLPIAACARAALNVAGRYISKPRTESRKQEKAAVEGSERAFSSGTPPTRTRSAAILSLDGSGEACRDSQRRRSRRNERAGSRLSGRRSPDSRRAATGPTLAAHDKTFRETRSITPQTSPRQIWGAHEAVTLLDQELAFERGCAESPCLL